MDDTLIEPRDPAQASQPDPTAPPAPEAEPSGLPQPLLEIPAMQAIMAGSPPAVSANIEKFSKDPAAKLIVENKDALMGAGVGFYKSLSGELGVIFNQLKIHPEDLQAADKMGKLPTIAPSFDSVNHEVSKSGLKNPVLRPANVGAPAQPTLKAPPQSAQMVSPAPAPQPAPQVKQATAALQKQILGLRAKNTQPGAPTSGAAPGAGRLLNSILKPAV